MLHEQIFSLEIAARGPYTAVRAVGEIDIAAVIGLRDAVRRAAARGPRVVVDLGAVTFMDTFALRALIALQQESHESEEWSLHVIAGSSRCVQRLLDVADARSRLRWMSPEQLAG